MMKKTKKMTSGQKIILGLMFLVVVYLCAIFVALIPPSASPSPTNPITHPTSAINQTPTPLQHKKFMAQIKCERFIKDRLVSLSSAKFSNTKTYKANGQPANYHVVTGIIESQNRLSVLLRSEYRCDLHYLAADPSVWVLDYLDIEN